MTIPYPININIPNAPNNPADDQPKMKVNFANINGYLSVDHVAPGDEDSGTHKQVTYENFYVPAVPVDPITVAYTDQGVADPTHPQHYWINSQGTFPLSAIRAFATFTSVLSPGAVAIGNSINVDTITGGVNVIGGGGYVVNLTANSTNGLEVLVFIKGNPIASAFGYTFALNQITITCTGAFPGSKINVLVIQI